MSCAQERLSALGLTVAAEHLDTLSQTAAAQQWNYSRFLEELLAGEQAARYQRARSP